jgi:hypothetical protein
MDVDCSGLDAPDESLMELPAMDRPLVHVFLIQESMDVDTLQTVRTLRFFCILHICVFHYILLY